MEIVIGIVTAIILLIALVIFILLYFGIINSYHPMTKAKDNQIRIACVGDSITYGFFVKNWRKNNYPAVLSKLLGNNYCVNNYAYTNRTALKNADYPLTNEKVYRQSLSFNPEIVLIMLGTNDSKKNNWDKDKFTADYSELIDSYTSLESSPKVYVLLPLPLFEVNGKVKYQLRKDTVTQEVIPTLKRIADCKNVGVIDVYEVFKGRDNLFVDGVHPNYKGSKLLAQSIFDVLQNDGVI